MALYAFPRAARSLTLLALGTLALVTPATVAASPVRVGVQAAGGYAEAPLARLTGALELGLSPHWSFRFAAGPHYAERHAGVSVLAGPVYALDVFKYVPRLVVLGGADVPQGRARLQGGMELLRTVGLHAGVSVGAYATWRPGGQAGGLLAVGGEWEL